MIEPTDQQLDDEEVGEPEVLQFADKLIYMDNGTLLIGRVILHRDSEKFVYVYRPAEIWSDEMGSHMKPWIPESSDEYFPIPARAVLNVTEPREVFRDAYYKGFMSKAAPPVDPSTGLPIKVFH